MLFFFAFGLPEIGINGSYFCVRRRRRWSSTPRPSSARRCAPGINSVSAGQAEAARAIGLTFTQSLRQVVLPQAFRTVVPPLGSVIIAMVKNTAVVGAFGVGGDLFSVGSAPDSSPGYADLPVLTGSPSATSSSRLPAGVLLGVLERKVAIAR